MRDKSVHRLVLTAVFIALTTIATMVIHIPLPATSGFLNFGDVVIFVSAILAGPQVAILAGGVGSALADLFLGYAYYAPYTLVVKGLEGLVAGLLAWGMFRGGRARLIRGTLGLILGAAVMVSGYYVAGGIMYGFEVSWLEIPYNLIQGYVSAGVALILGLILSRILKKDSPEQE